MPSTLEYRPIGFRGLRVNWHCPFSCAIQTKDIVVRHLDFIIDLHDWHKELQAVVSDLCSVVSDI